MRSQARARADHTKPIKTVDIDEIEANLAIEFDVSKEVGGYIAGFIRTS